MLPKLKCIFFFFLIVITGAGCTINTDKSDSGNGEACTPQKYFSVANDEIESFALVTCENGKSIGTYNILPGDSLVVVPNGGTHLLYVRFHPDWAPPENIPLATEDGPAGIEIFAGSCALDPPTVCLPETNLQGEPIENNRITSQTTLVDERTLKIEYILPESPRQVTITLNYCTIWPPDSRHCTGNPETGLGAYLSYVFRYESVAHITADTQDPDAECDCNK